MVQNTKAKIRRTLKNYGIDLSSEIPTPTLESFKSREQYNEWKEKANSFTNRANKNYQFVKNSFGVVASKKEIAEVQRNTKIAQRIADKLRKEANKKPFISGGKVQGTVGQRMLQMNRPDTAGISRPPNFFFDSMRSRGQFEKKKKNMEERSDEKFFDKRMETMKENFINMLEQSFNSDANNLVEKLRSVPAEDFYEMYLMFDEFDFDMFYTNDYSGDTHDNQINQMETYVDRYNNGNINLDLKGF